MKMLDLLKNVAVKCETLTNYLEIISKNYTKLLFSSRYSITVYVASRVALEFLR